MSKIQKNISNKEGSNMANTSLLVAFTASLCCITPVLALISGVGGVAATFSWMEPFRPYLIGLTVAVLGFAWYQKLKPKKQEDINCDCEEDGKEPFIQSKKFLGVVTILAAVLLTFPNYAYVFYPEVTTSSVTTESSIAQLNLEIKGMTCTGCEEHIKHAASGVDGVTYIETSYDQGKAVIQFDQTVTTEHEIANAVNATGYKITKTLFFKQEKFNFLYLCRLSETFLLPIQFVIIITHCFLS